MPGGNGSFPDPPGPEGIAGKVETDNVNKWNYSGSKFKVQSSRLRDYRRFEIGIRNPDAVPAKAGNQKKRMDSPGSSPGQAESSAE
jgi:hypothetical protein